jgi:hypothetical protein
VGGHLLEQHVRNLRSYGRFAADPLELGIFELRRGGRIPRTVALVVEDEQRRRRLIFIELTG